LKLDQFAFRPLVLVYYIIALVHVIAFVAVLLFKAEGGEFLTSEKVFSKTNENIAVARELVSIFFVRNCVNHILFYKKDRVLRCDEL
jgi:hypothetical protein